VDGGGTDRNGRPLRAGAADRGSHPLSERTPIQARRAWSFENDTAEIADAVVLGAEDKLATDPVVLDVRELQDTFDALIITSGRTDRQVRAIVEEVERKVAADTGARPIRVEGLDTAEWVALDYGAVVVHVFDAPTREYYDLEHLWSAAPRHRRGQRAINEE
jgi:ribosome-associated protein